MELGLKILASYLLGSISGSLTLGRLKGGVDIRKQGSGNAGGTNALRTQGIWFALGVVVIDIGKGALAAGPIAAINGNWSTAVFACAAAAVVGHCFPLWHGFRGGKGAATLIGAIAVIHWPMVLAMLLVWLAMVMLSGYVGLATMTSAFAGVVYQAVTGAPGLEFAFAFFVAMAVFIVFTHRSNVRRMLGKNENRNQRLWLFKPRP